MKEFSLIFALIIGALVAYAARSYQRTVMALDKAEQLQELAKREIALATSAATDPAANTSVVEQSAADVSLDIATASHAAGKDLSERSEYPGPKPERPPLESGIQPVAFEKPAPVYRVARPAPTRQYSSCGPGGCAPSGPIRRLFGRR